MSFSTTLLPPGTRIVYSTEEYADPADQLGATHYSYGFAARKFLEAFRKLGLTPQRLSLPQYYGGRGLPGFEDKANTRPIHLIFRSPENIRTVTGCYNICCFAWEFGVLKTDTLPFEHPFRNQKRMLEYCQEIWVPCTYSLEVLLEFGLKNVHYVPAPVPIPELPKDEEHRLPSFFSLWRVPSLCLKVTNVPGRDTIQRDIHNPLTPITSRACIVEAMNANQVFLSVLNPHDKRKNLQEMVFAFMTILEKHPKAVLVLKLVLSERLSPLDTVLDAVLWHYFDRPITLVCDRIVITSGYLSDEEMTALYKISDFYLCASVAEGQNLPLIEAMSHGVIPVSTIHTAMDDYLNQDNCVAIRTRPFSAYQPDMAAAITSRPYSVQFASQADVARALLRACAIAPTDISRMREAARDTVAQKFSLEAVTEFIRDRITAIVGGCSTIAHSQTPSRVPSEFKEPGEDDNSRTAELVHALYETLLLRSADPDGLKEKVDAILCARYGFKDLIRSILESPEFSEVHSAFYRRYIDPSIARFTNDSSQYGETNLLIKHMVNEAAAHRIVVDVGARGREGSNSYDLVRFFGWRGLLIEANPAVIDEIRDEFAGLDVEILNCAVSDYTGEGVLHIGANYDVSSLVEENTLNWGEVRGTVAINVKRLSEILEAFLIPSDFDLLSLDIEGEDIKALNELVESGSYRPRWVIIEASYDFRTRSLDDLPFSPTVRNEYDIVAQTAPNLILKAR
jgi:FkbM family methyltransferase